MLFVSIMLTIIFCMIDEADTRRKVREHAEELRRQNYLRNLQKDIDNTQK